MSLGDFLGGVQSVVETGIRTLPQIVAAGRSPAAFDPSTLSLPQSLGAFGSALTPGAGPVAGIGGGACAQFVPTRTRLRAQRELRAVNPSTGKIESWTHRGSPLVWSGDRAIAKRFAKATGQTLRRRTRARPRTTRRR